MVTQSTAALVSARRMLDSGIDLAGNTQLPTVLPVAADVSEGAVPPPWEVLGNVVQRRTGASGMSTFALVPMIPGDMRRFQYPPSRSPR
jgi:hypothetical protein